MQLALFDFDGTISNRDTISDFIVHACGKRTTLLGLIRLSPTLLAYGLKLISHHDAKQATIKHYFGNWEKDAFIDAAQNYARCILPTIIRPDALDKIRWHIDMGHIVSVVSGSLDILLSEWCSNLGINLIATGVDLDGSHIGLSTHNCYSNEKARRIREKYDLKSFELIYAYGDSSGDKEMMALADRQFYKHFK